MTKKHLSHTKASLFSKAVIILAMIGPFSLPSVFRPTRQSYKLFGLLMGFSVCLLNLTALGDSPWQDIPDDFWANDAIELLSERAIITPGPDQRFQPYKPMTRAEFASILAKSVPSPHLTPSRIRFVDVPPGHWAASAIQSVVSQGWMNGVTPQQFRPSQVLSLGELYASLGHALGDPLKDDEVKSLLAPYRDQSELPPWARLPVAQALAKQLTLTERSKSKLSPSLPATRASVAQCVAKAIQPALRQQPLQNQSPSVAESPSPSLKPTVNPVDTHPLTVNKTDAPKAILEAEEAKTLLSGVNLVGQLVRRGQDWQLTRADGQSFLLEINGQNTQEWQANQTFQVTGNLDGLRSQPSLPVVVVHTAHPIIPDQSIAATSQLNLKTESQADNNTQKASPSPESSLGQTNTPALVGSSLEIPLKMENEPAKTQAKSGSMRALFFPNLANLITDPALLLGEGARRNPLSWPQTPKDAVMALLKGPTDAEKQAGFFNDDDLKRLQLDKLSVSQEGLATVQLYAPGDFQFSNSSVPARLDAQIRRTLTQFPEVQRVQVSVKNPKNKVLWISP